MYLVPYLPKTMVDYHQKQQLLLNLIMDDKRTNSSQLDRFDSCYLTIHNTYMVNNYGNDLAMAIKERRILIPLTLRDLGAKSGVSSSHLSRIEKRERFPSAHILQKVAKPLGFDENELFMLAGYLSHQSPIEVGSHENHYHQKGLDPCVASVLAQEPVKIQRTVIGILRILRSLAKSTEKYFDNHLI